MSNTQLTVRGLLERDSVKNRISEILGKRGPQFAASLVQLTRQSFMLQKCRPESVVGSALTAAALDLSIDPNLGQAHVVPYGEEAQFQMGYKGLIQLAQRSAQIVRLNDVVIPKGSLISWDRMREEIVVDFEREGVDWDSPERGYVFYFKTVSGFEKMAFMTAHEARRHGERFSKAFHKPTSPWKTDFDAMALKTLIKRILGRYAPLSIEVQQGISRDQGVIELDSEGNMSVDYPDNPSRADQPPRAEVPDETISSVDVSQVEPKEREASDDKSEAKILILAIENALLDAQVNGAKFFAWLQERGYIAKSANALKDAPASKLQVVARKIDQLIEEHGKP